MIRRKLEVGLGIMNEAIAPTKSQTRKMKHAAADDMTTAGVEPAIS